MNSALLSAILGLGLLLSGLSTAIGAEVAAVPVAPLPSQAEAIEAIANLANPEKLATLGDRGGNTRIQKITYWLFVVRQNGGRLDAALDAAFASFGWKGTPMGEETKLTLIRNFQRAENLGCFTAEGLAEMRRGRSPIIRRGNWYGDKMSVDHIIPRAKVPELDNVLANLELMPSRMNADKSDSIGAREIELARRFVAAGLISPDLVAWAAPFPGKSTVVVPTPARPSSTPALKQLAPIVSSSPSHSYFASKRSEVFHQSDCKSVATISSSNLVKYGNREGAIEAGKKPCTICKP